MENDSEEQLSLFAEDTHANHLAQQGCSVGQKMTVISGQKCIELLKIAGRDGYLPKMLLGTSIWGSMMCSLTWKPRNTPGGRLLCQLSPSMLTTAEIDSGLWATPNTMDHMPQRSHEALRRQATTTRKGRTKPANLREQVDPEVQRLWLTPTATENAQDLETFQKRMEKYPNGTQVPNLSTQINHPQFWPTPKASGQENPETLIERKGVKAARTHNLTAAVQMLPTPTAQEVRNGWQARHADAQGTQESLTTIVMKGEGREVGEDWEGGQLNPDWVESLMGFPPGWTDLNISGTLTDLDNRDSLTERSSEPSE